MRGTTEKTAGEEPVDSPQNSKPLKEQVKQMLDTELAKMKIFFLLSILNLQLEIVLEGKKEIVLWYTISILKLRKRKKQSNFTNPDPWARIVGSRNTAAIYTDGRAPTALYDSEAELQLISKDF